MVEKRVFEINNDKDVKMQRGNCKFCKEDKMKENIEELELGLNTAFIDSTINSNLAYRPEFISNDYKEGKKVLSTLENELRNCDEFYFSVAFITSGGIQPFLMLFKELENKGIKGKILTTNYLNFSEPKALNTLYGLKNIDIKMYMSYDKEGFHTKGYIFRKGAEYRIIVGSSNMTINALTINKEWNTKLVSTEKGQYAINMISEFDNLWNSEKSKDYSEIKDKYCLEYETRRNIVNEQKRIAKREHIVLLNQYKLEPNSMQMGFIENLKKLIAQGEKKALLISATGTGKTYASAFAMRELGFKHVLFLVHRNQIVRQALKSFGNVFGDTVSMGMISGTLGIYETENDYIFSTIQTLSKEHNLRRFAPDYFDCIIYDEAHHTSADSYKKIMKYFTSNFALGMTATPDKRDDNVQGKNIYEIFEHNIAYEIRLQQAMEENLLCTFHYYGITDLIMIGDDKKSREEQLEKFIHLISDERVDYIMKQAGFYGFSGNRVKGLMFCSRLDEAIELSEKFNERGLRTLVLSSADTSETRTLAIDRLVNDNEAEVAVDNRLDYILSVDIFSEGVDVPEINQVIMLRPTQSPIVFIQQLGRGLRKTEEKEYVVVIDFIGNYKNNFMIPIALSGDKTYNKDNVRKYVLEGSRIIPGSSTLHFDEISRKKIFQAIDNANFSDIKLIKENYKKLKDKLGHIPSLLDFDKYGEMDVCRIFDNNKLGSYHKFLVNYEKEYKVSLSENEEKVVEFISKKLANGKRIHELELLNRMLIYRHGLIGILAYDLEDKYDIRLDKIQAENIINIMTNEFSVGTGKKTYESCVFIEKEYNYQDLNMDHQMLSRISAYAIKLFGNEMDYRITNSFSKMLENKEFYDIVKELIEFGISRYKSNFTKHYQDTELVLYQKYTYEDVCRLLGWEKNLTSVMNGYMLDKKTNTFPVFINYDKLENISETTKYEDYFTSNQSLIAISKSGRNIQSDDVQNFLHAKERGIDVHLFVRKNKNDKISKEFYYLGRMSATGNVKEFVMNNTDKTAVEIEWKLDTVVREDVYEYIVNG